MAEGTRRAITGPSPVDDYETREDVRTLHSAHKIRSDPKRHGRAKAMAKSMYQAAIAKTAPQGGDPDGDTVSPMMAPRGKGKAY